MQKKVFGALALFAGAAVLGLNVTLAEEAVSIGAAAPTFTLADQSGKQVNLADFAGKVVVLEWLNPGCPFVVRHYKAKTMASLVAKYADKDVVWLAVNSTSGADAAGNANWVTENALTYPILDDHEGKVGKLYGAKTTPHMFVIGKDGKLAYIGAIDSDAAGDATEKVNYVDKALGEILEGKAVSTPQTKSYGCSVKFAA